MFVLHERRREEEAYRLWHSTNVPDVQREGAFVGPYEKLIRWQEEANKSEGTRWKGTG